MSRLDELIAELCPDGVEYKTLGEVVVISRGIRVVRSQLSESAEGRCPVFQNSMTPLGYFEKSNCSKDTTFVISAGAAGEIGYSYSSFWAADDCYYFECPESLSSRYLYYALLSQQAFIFSRVRKASIPRLPRAVIDKLKIPLPPLEVQREIVRILDAYSEKVAELTDKLASELDARKKQYEYYRNYILTSPNAPHYSLDELCDIVDYRGKTPKKVDSGIFLVTAKNIRRGYIDYECSKEYVSEEDYAEVMHRGLPKVGDVLITTEAPCGFVAQIDRENIALAQRVIKYRPKTEMLNPTYLKHLLLGAEFQSKLLQAATGSTVKGIKGSKLHKLTIPLPPLEIQEHIVSILDRFDKLCNDITLGLPAEIEARRKQYEHYRDRLLTFKEKTA